MGYSTRSDTGPFALIPEWVIDAKISGRAFKLYAVLARYADDASGEAWPSRALLGKRLGCSVDTVDRATEELVVGGMLQKQSRFSSGGDRTSNLYRVIRVDPAAEMPPPLSIHAATGGRMDAAENETHLELEPEERDLQRAKPAQVVFDAWKLSTGRDRSVLDAKRKKLITARLQDFTVEDLCQAVQGWKHSKFHSGDNDRRKVYNDIELILRDAAHVEQFLTLARAPAERGGPTNPAARRFWEEGR